MTNNQIPETRNKKQETSNPESLRSSRKPETRFSVFCGSSSGNNPQFKNAAIDLAKTLVKNNINLVYGGGKIGLMGILADTVLQEGGEVFGVIPGFLEKKEVAHQGITTLHVVNSMHERKELMADISDGFIALPGGLGTMDEFFEIVTWAQLGLHSKPCGILNVNGYFDHIMKFLNNSVKNGFIQQEFVDMIFIEEEPQILIGRFLNYQHPKIEKKLKVERR